MLDTIGEANMVAAIGLVGGIALGLAARIGRFCTLGAIEDVLYSSDDRRIRMWGIAIGTAIIGAHLAAEIGTFDFTQPVYLAQTWNPLASIAGGLMFGYGMALAGNCGFGALARMGGGDLKSLIVVVVMGIAAFFAMSGPVAHARIWMFPAPPDPDAAQGFGQLFERVLGVTPWLTGVIIGGAFVAISALSAPMRKSPGHVFWGFLVGAVVVSGWVGTSWVATYGFAAERVVSHAYAAPVGETLLYLMTASGTPISFAVGSVSGVLLGSIAGAAWKRQLRWEACDDPRELRRNIAGAALMGVGAILAVGCSFGQGITAFSVLAYSAPVVALAIFAGAAIGLRHMIEGYSSTE